MVFSFTKHLFCPIYFFKTLAAYLCCFREPPNAEPGDGQTKRKSAVCSLVFWLTFCHVVPCIAIKAGFLQHKITLSEKMDFWGQERIQGFNEKFN